MFASGTGNTGFAAEVINDDAIFAAVVVIDDVGCFGAVAGFGTVVGLTGSFFTVFSVVLIFEEVVPDDACCEATSGDLLFFPNDWAATGTLVEIDDDPPKTGARLFIGKGGGVTPPPRCRVDESRLCGGNAGTTTLDSPTSFTRASNPASWYSRNRE